MAALHLPTPLLLPVLQHSKRQQGERSKLADGGGGAAGEDYSNHTLQES